MAERSTRKIFDKTGKQQDIYEWSSVSSLECNKKLGKLEDIMEKYGIESVEELDKLIDGLQASIKVLIERSERYKIDRDTWKRACELACDVILRFTDGCPCKADYFYQQAKTEGENK